jgi:hypothetical protein
MCVCVCVLIRKALKRLSMNEKDVLLFAEEEEEEEKEKQDKNSKNFLP